MKTRSFLLIGMLVMSLCACATETPQQKTDARPEWFFTPGMAGGIGGVGIAGRHVRGLNAQKTLAIERAIDDIARQLGVEVKNITEVAATGNRNQSKAEMTSYSIHTVSGETVRAVIKAVWEDPESEQLYVWMVVQD